MGCRACGGRKKANIAAYTAKKMKTIPKQVEDSPKYETIYERINGRIVPVTKLVEDKPST